MTKFKTIQDVKIEGEVVLLRADYNVPLRAANDDDNVLVLDESLAVTTGLSDPVAKQTDNLAAEQYVVESDLRIKSSLPTIRYLLDQGVAKIIIMSHLGRPEGRDNKLSLRPVAMKLAELLPGVTVDFVDQTTGAEVEAAVEDLPEGGILLLENLRFDAREEENSEEFAREIAISTHAALFVQDGFAVLHRAHASTSAITKFLPSVAGLLVMDEIENLAKVTENPEKPFVVVIGGSKVDDKAPLIEKFAPIADQIYVGGKIAADGYEGDDKILVARDFDEDESGAKLDIGPESMADLAQVVSDAKTVLWNGCLGKVEDAAYATSSTILAKILGESNKTTIICGGDTAGFVENLRESDPELRYSLISTGGGAALEFLLGNSMPGIEALGE